LEVTHPHTCEEGAWLPLPPFLTTVEQLVSALPPHALLLSAVHRGVVSSTHSTAGGQHHCQQVWRSPQNAVTLTETRLLQLQRVRDVATRIRRCWCRRDAKHPRGTCLGGRDRLPWRALGRVAERGHTCGSADARRVYTMRVTGGRGARCFRGCEVELIETLREMAA
jgi:hypothetical protein